jgi:ABC-type cobalt transport system substrate-binding protein
MNNQSKTILYIVSIIVVLVLLFFIFNTSPSPVSPTDSKGNDNGVEIKQEQPEITYPKIIYPSGESNSLSDKEKELLRAGGIDPFLKQVAEWSYDVVSIKITIIEDTKVIEAELKNKESDEVTTYTSPVFKNSDGTYKYYEGPPPGYRG